MVGYLREPRQINKQSLADAGVVKAMKGSKTLVQKTAVAKTSKTAVQKIAMKTAMKASKTAVAMKAVKASTTAVARHPKSKKSK